MNAQTQEWLLDGLNDHLSSRVMSATNNLSTEQQLQIWAIARDAYLQGAIDCDKLISAECQETLNAHLNQVSARNLQAWQATAPDPKRSHNLAGIGHSK